VNQTTDSTKAKRKNGQKNKQRSTKYYLRRNWTTRTPQKTEDGLIKLRW